MPIRVGRRKFNTDPVAGEKAVEALLLKQLKDKTIRAGLPRLQAISDLMLSVATAEAQKLFVVLADRLDEGGDPIRALTGADLAEGMSARVSVGGQVVWDALNQRYYNWKGRVRPDNQDKMFRFNNGATTLSSYFRRSSASIVDSRLGGVQLSINTAPRDEEDTTLDPKNPPDLDGEELDIFIGRIGLRIFPDITASLLPGLASNRWMAINEGDPSLELEIFDGLRTADKLAQPHNGRFVYRPLVVPAMQFWILIRIPQAVRAAVARQFSRMNLNIDKRSKKTQEWDEL